MLPIVYLLLSLHYREKMECILRSYIIMIGRMIPLKDMYELILGICENVTLHRKRDFADVIKVTELLMGRLYWIIQVGQI